MIFIPQKTVHIYHMCILCVYYTYDFIIFHMCLLCIYYSIYIYHYNYILYIYISLYILFTVYGSTPPHLGWRLDDPVAQSARHGPRVRGSVRLIEIIEESTIINHYPPLSTIINHY